MNIYEWSGSEALGSSLVTAQHMLVEWINDDNGTLIAAGTISICDHIEGISWTDHWAASGRVSQGKLVWHITKKQNPNEHVCFKDRRGELTFCGLESVNQAIRDFISVHLSEVVTWWQENPDKPLKLVAGPKTYDGLRHRYTGPCLCSEIESSSAENPFDWLKHTNNGQFPANCFECSCQTRWFQGDPDDHIWCRVVDADTWEMLTRFNGVIIQPVGIDPRDTDVPQIILVHKLREAGFIPLG